MYLRRFDDPDPTLWLSLGVWSAVAVVFLVRVALAPEVAYSLLSLRDSSCGFILIPPRPPEPLYRDPPLAVVVDQVPYPSDPNTPVWVQDRVDTAIDACEPRIRHERLQLSIELDPLGQVSGVSTDPADSIGPCVREQLGSDPFPLHDTVLQTVVDWSRR